MSQSRTMTDDRRAELALTTPADVAAMEPFEVRAVRGEIFILLLQTSLAPGALIRQEPWVAHFVSRSLLFTFKDQISKGRKEYQNKSVEKGRRQQHNVPDEIYEWIRSAKMASPLSGAQELLDLFKVIKMPGWPPMTLWKMQEALKRLADLPTVPEVSLEAVHEVKGTAYGLAANHVVAYDAIEFRRNEMVVTKDGIILPKYWVIAIVDLFSRALLWLTFHASKPIGADYVAAIYGAMQPKPGIAYRGLCKVLRRDNEHVNLAPEVEWFRQEIGAARSESILGYPEGNALNENGHKTVKRIIRKEVLRHFFRSSLVKAHAGAGVPLELLESQRIPMMLEYGHSYPKGHTSYDRWVRSVSAEITDNPDLMLTLNRACRFPREYQVDSGKIMIGGYPYVAPALNRYEGKKLTVYPHLHKTEVVIDAETPDGDRFPIRIANPHFAAGQQMAVGDGKGAAAILDTGRVPMGAPDPEAPAPPVSAPPEEPSIISPPIFGKSKSPWPRIIKNSFALQ